ncbi:hypothetical protein DFP72DRAFT_880604 [Ephemerocybe angulata]|uniref:Uncharacterized protein n=1 Tax=Ephemerocybe angulata TaxID=980116 RepID=A0A8H6I9A6_9AGAR|nr:hypothetical protein DFP72DRAFT_880604 [Tulosesus angulatus]
MGRVLAGAGVVFCWIDKACPHPASSMTVDITHHDERTLAFTPRPGVTTREPEQRSHVKCFKEAMIIFKDQDEGVRLPTYSRGGIVSGEIGLTCPDQVLEVNVKLYGQMSLMAAEYGTSGATLVSHKETLWASKPAGGDQQALRQDHQIAAHIRAHFHVYPGLDCQVQLFPEYTIVKTRRYRFASWNVSKTFSVATAPIVMVDTVFSSLKPVPEEWRQLVATSETTIWILLIPSVPDLVPPSSCLLDPEKKRKDNSFLPRDSDGVRVRIVRQIQVEVDGHKRVRTVTIGTSKMNPMPPALAEVHSTNEICVDWQGEVKCMEDITCGGFSAGGLTLIVLDLIPITVRESQPIRLVTDTWTDTDGVPPQDT